MEGGDRLLLTTSGGKQIVVAHFRDDDRVNINFAPSGVDDDIYFNLMSGEDEGYEHDLNAHEGENSMRLGEISIYSGIANTDYYKDQQVMTDDMKNLLSFQTRSGVHTFSDDDRDENGFLSLLMK